MSNYGMEFALAISRTLALLEFTLILVVFFLVSWPALGLGSLYNSMHIPLISHALSQEGSRIGMWRVVVG